LKGSRTIRTIILSGLLLVAQQGIAQSVLQSGMWYKLAIEKTGVYKITYDQFRNMGFGSVDPRRIKIFGNTGGMLPQSNSALRPIDLTEQAIFVEGESDGKFGSGDYILWYAQGPDLVAFDQQRDIFKYESNLYSARNYYFITVGTDNGKRVGTSQDVAGTFPAVDTYDDFAYYEKDLQNVLKSGREWYGERFDFTPTYSFPFDIAGILPNSPVRFVSDVVGQSVKPAAFKIYINNALVGQQTPATIPESQYGEKGSHRRDTLLLNSTTIQLDTRTTQEVRYEFVKASSGLSGGVLDFFLLSFRRRLELYGNQTVFRAASSTQQPISTFNIKGVSTGCNVWEVTNPAEPLVQTFTLTDKASFSTASSSLKTFVVFNATIPAPEFVETVANQNIHGYSTPNLVIVTHPDFKAQAERLAQHRSTHSQWTSVVVTPAEIYNEFSSGRQDVTAIRDFVKYLYNQSPSTLKAVLLIGKSSYDYKDRMPNNTNFVPTYESRNALTPLKTYASDDFFGFMEDAEGNWGEENPIQNHTLDIGVGRFPVKTAAEAEAVVDKIIEYDTNKKNFSGWRKDIVFVADDGSNSDGFTREHQRQADLLATEIEDIHPEFNTKKIFLGTYAKTVRPSGETIPQVNAKIVEKFDRGSLIINYTGHGSEQLWADERIFTTHEIENLGNKLYPFLVTATCEFGRQDDPAQTSSAELTVIRPRGGAIGLVTTSRPVYAVTNFDLNEAFYQALFQQSSNQYLPLGEIFARTKNNSISGVGNRNFSLMGDPSLTLAMPTQQIEVTEFKTTTGSDTLKALSTVVLRGEVRDNIGNKIDNFQGTLEATLFDKETDFVTIGKNNPPFSFQEWSNVLFRGKATVQDGAFEMQFMLPKNISYEIDFGKLSLYASDTDQELDAKGASTSFKIGGTEPDPEADNTPPVIELFMGDTTFVSGGIVSPSTQLVAKFTDASGINISNYGIGNSLTAYLDNDAAVYQLSDYFVAAQDDFTKGWVYFPINGLSPGKHSITVKGWDTHNNSAQATIEFWVSDGEGLLIETFGNYPNPFSESTTLFFTHNRSGDDIEGVLIVFDALGKEILRYQFQIPESPYEVTLTEIGNSVDMAKKLTGGLYWARLAVRSLSNGSKNERVTKLIAVN